MSEKRRGRNYNPEIPGFWGKNHAELVSMDVRKKNVAERQHANFEEMKELRQLLLHAIKSTVEELISEDSSISQEELAKTLVSTEIINKIVTEILKGEKTSKTKAAVQSVYYELIIEYSVQYMINEEKKSNPNIALSVGKAISCDTVEGREFVKQMIQNTKFIMEGCNISPMSVTKKIKYIAQKLANREIKKTSRDVQNREPEDMEQ